ncbi:MAG: type II secretion system F family protein [Solobacterium sp.]|nr:type II secretion system F family protein [Solobacterium sp.]
MVTYKYSAMSPDGAKVNGVIEAIDEFAAVERIKATCPVVLSISEVKSADENSILNMEIGSNKVDPKSLSVMCSQFATILSAGVDVASCMEMIGNQTEDKKLKKMLLNSAKDVAQGNSIAASMEKNCPGLPVTFIETVRAGELSGTLEDSFATLQTYFERNYQLKQKVKSALSYPMFVVVVAVIVVIVVMVKVVPTLTQVFGDLGGELPFITVLLINISKFFTKAWPIILLVAIVGFLAFKFYTNTEKGKIWWGKTLLSMPVMGKINTFSGSADFASTMSALLSAGLPVTNALEVTSKVLDNYVLGTETNKLAQKVQTGVKLGDAMRNSGVFPQTLTEMTAIGENTGELEKTLKTVGNYYSQEADYAMSAAISKLEPTLLVFLAAFAGFIVLAIYMPMFTMYNLF